MNQLSMDELQRIVELGAGASGGTDMVMLFDNAGTVVEGESVRKYPDGKARLDICGWSWGQVANATHGVTDTGRYLSPLTVVRNADAATGSLATLASNRSQKITATISVFRSGGDAVSVDTEPMVRLEIREAQIVGQYLVTGADASLKEVLILSYRSVIVGSAAQKASGSRGAVRECHIYASNAS